MPIHGSVAEVLRRQRRELPRFFYEEADAAGAIVVEEVVDRTPVGRIIDPDTGFDEGPSGVLREGWEQLPVTRRRGGVYQSGAVNDVDYALAVNNGSKPHIIRGRMKPNGRRRMLRFWSAGALQMFSQVNHPGAPGHHMAEVGIAAADLRWMAEGRARLQEWLRRTDH
jgi:hypothetical protein